MLRVSWSLFDPRHSSFAYHNVEALAREVKTLAKLSHPNVVRLLGFAESIKENIARLIFAWAHNGNIHVFLKSGHWEIPERIALVRVYDISDKKKA